MSFSLAKEPNNIKQAHNRALVVAASGNACSPSNVRSIRLESASSKPIQMFELHKRTLHLVWRWPQAVVR
jgi:hypothetical protein